MSEGKPQDQNVYAITKVIEDYVAPFMEKYGPKSPASLDADGWITAD